MKFVIVTGMSGAGKSTVLKFLEDVNFSCIDNLPPSLIPELAKVYSSDEGEVSKVALGIDIRGGKLFQDLFRVLDTLKRDKFAYEILFLDSSDETLISRFKETRRSHPLAKNDRLSVGIEKEREILEEIKKRANYIIDTSHILTRQLKEKVNEIFVGDKKFDSLMITVLSFGFKYGIPTDSDLVFDVRFLTNPFYIPDLREKTGNDIEVSSYVMNMPQSKQFLSLLTEMILFLIPNYIHEGKNRLVISIGCTGGKHRSVTLANELFRTLQYFDHSAIILHRDIDKDLKKI